MPTTDRTYGFRTRSVHAGSRPDPVTGARAVPIYQTTSFVFADAAEAADLFALQTYGNIYTRISNPTVAAFEERMASLEGGLGAVATSSGQAAEMLTVAALAGAGDHIVSSSQLYGGTRTLLDVTLRRFGVDTTFVAEDDPAAFDAAIGPHTKAVYTEVIANPSGRVADLTALADVAHAHDVPLIVDATTATPYLCRPIEHGVDIVLHSATKFIGGHGTSLGGVVVESGRFDWSNGRFPLMTEPVPSYGALTWWGNFGEYGWLTRLRSEQLRDVGATLSPFNAFLLLQGLETLALRMDAHVSNAQRVAEFLVAHPAVDVGRLRRAARLTVARTGAPLPPGRAGLGAVVRGARRAEGRGGDYRSVRALQPPGQHRRHPHAGHPPRQHDPSAARRRRARRRRRSRGPRPHLGRHRGRRRHLRRPRSAPSSPPDARERPSSGRHHRPASGWRCCDATRTVAVVGASSNPARASYFVATYLLGSTDYTVWFVNPRESEILGHPVYASLAALPGRPDLVDVFRRADDLPEMARRRRRRRGRCVLGPTRPAQRRGGRDRHSRRSGRRHQPLPEDRARPLRRRAAHRRVRHRGDRLAASPPRVTTPGMIDPRSRRPHDRGRDPAPPGSPCSTSGRPGGYRQAPMASRRRWTEGLVAVAAVVAGVVGALAPPAPTGRANVDAAIMAVAVAATVFVGALAPWWAAVLLAGVATSIAADPDVDRCRCSGAAGRGGRRRLAAKPSRGARGVDRAEPQRPRPGRARPVPRGSPRSSPSAPGPSCSCSASPASERASGGCRDGGRRRPRRVRRVRRRRLRLRRRQRP